MWKWSVVVLVLVLGRGAFADDAGSDPCMDEHFVHAVDSRLHTGRCVALSPVVIPTRHGNLTVRVLRFESLRADTAPIQRQLADWARRVGGAANTLGAQLPDKATVLLDSEPIAAETRAASWGSRVEDECTLGYHFNDGSPRKLFEVAHGLFHCMQAKQWDDARLGSTDADWWAEGSAELFASLAFAGSGLTADDAATFHAHEESPLINRSYDAVVFFDWFLAAKGPAELMGLLDGVHDLAGGAALRGLREAVHKDDWVAFEEAYYDHHINEPGGGPLPYPDTPDPPLTRIDSSGTKRFSADPYVIKRALIELKEDKTYTLDRTGQSPKIIMQWSENAGPWAEPPETVHVCHHPKRFRAVVGTTDATTTMTIRVTARPEHDCPCVVGSWQQTPESLSRVGQRLQAQGVNAMTCSYTSGSTRLEVHDDHTGGDTYQALTTQCQSRLPNTSTTNGTLSFTWALTDDQLQLTYTGSTAKTHTHMTVHGRAVDQDVPMAGSGTNTAHMRCEGDHLHLEYGTAAFDYTRVTP